LLFGVSRSKGKITVVFERTEEARVALENGRAIEHQQMVAQRDRSIAFYESNPGGAVDHLCKWFLKVERSFDPASSMQARRQLQAQKDFAAASLSAALAAPPRRYNYDAQGKRQPK
jgi:hypothetical protein